MKRTFLLKTMLLLCALVVGGSAWAQTQTTLWSENFSSYSANDVPSGGTYSYVCTNGSSGSTTGNTVIYAENSAGGSSPELMVSKYGGTFKATIPLNNIEGDLTLTYKQNGNTLSVSTTTTGITGSGSSSTSGTKTVTFKGVTKTMSSIVIVFTGPSGNKNVRLDDIVLTGYTAPTVAAPKINLDPGFYVDEQSVTITTNETGGTTYYTTDGTTPDNTSTQYIGAISISSSTTLKAVTYKGTEHSAVVSATYAFPEDGVFDFVNAGKTGYDYGSGVTVSTSYTTDDKEWNSGNVKMITSKVSGNGYRWYTDYTLRFYNESKATFSVPNGYVITQIVTTGANFDSATPSGLNGSTWTGASQQVSMTATATRNIETITVTYAVPATITAAEYATFYNATKALDFSGTDIAVYTAKDNGSNVTLSEITSGKVPANTPVVLYKAGGATINVPVIASAPAITATNDLRVSDGTTTLSNAYVLAKPEGQAVGFYPWGNSTLSAGKIYLQGSGTYTRDFIGIGDASSISDVKVNTNLNGNYYDLQGRQVAQPTKGLYIVNGKKVIIK